MRNLKRSGFIEVTTDQHSNNYLACLPIFGFSGTCYFRLIMSWSVMADCGYSSEVDVSFAAFRIF